MTDAPVKIVLHDAWEMTDLHKAMEVAMDAIARGQGVGETWGWGTGGGLTFSTTRTPRGVTVRQHKGQADG